MTPIRLIQREFKFKRVDKYPIKNQIVAKSKLIKESYLRNRRNVDLVDGDKRPVI